MRLRLTCPTRYSALDWEREPSSFVRREATLPDARLPGSVSSAVDLEGMAIRRPLPEDVEHSSCSTATLLRSGKVLITVVTGESPDGPIAGTPELYDPS